MDTERTAAPLMENTNPYPVIDEPVLGQPLTPQQEMNLVNVYVNPPNQGFQQNPYPPQGNRPPPPYLQPYPQQQGQQGFQPAPYNPQYMPPPPQQQTQVILKLPGYITTAHPQYRFVVEQCNMPCAGCSYRGADFVTMEPGCAAFGWAACLFFFTGFLCCWVPFVCDGCKDITIRCSRCRRTKYVIQKPCC